MEQPKDAMSALINLAISRKSKELVWIRNLMLKHIKYERYKVMIKLCKVTNKVAVHARLLNDGQRKKYKDQHYNVNGRTYYLFDRTTAWSVGSSLIKINSFMKSNKSIKKAPFHGCFFC